MQVLYRGHGQRFYTPELGLKAMSKVSIKNDDRMSLRHCIHSYNSKCKNQIGTMNRLLQLSLQKSVSKVRYLFCARVSDKKSTDELLC